MRVASSWIRRPPGQEVFVSAADFGTRQWGGWAGLVRVPADWCFALPGDLALRDAIVLGTAGFTATQCIEQLQSHGVRPDSGAVVVSGSTGGVGIFSVMLLAKLGYYVVASTGKPERHDWLRRLGASEVISRQDLDDRTSRPLLSSRWAGGVDAAGGNTLATMLRATRSGGCVTACGLANSNRLEMTVYPFILRGVCLQGIDSANVPRAECERIWNRMAGDLRIPDVSRVATSVALADVGSAVQKVLAGQSIGRTIVEVSP
jgi:putative YhdH/YhfP family quinone oxidoreductase